MARDRLPGVGSEASTAEASVAVGKSAFAWDTRNDQSRPTSLTSAARLAKPAQVGRGLGQGGVVRIGRRADRGQEVAEDHVPGRGRKCSAGEPILPTAQSIVWPASIWLT